jgi:hypothetical protein
MSYKTRVHYDDYEGLYAHESTAIVGYMERCDASELERIIREPPESHFSVKSQGMRDFIADVIAGKKTRPKHKKRSTEREDFEIYLRVRDLMDMGESRENAEAIVAKEIYKAESTVHKTYGRSQKRHFPKKAT